MLNDCKSNKSLCGDGDEAHCISNGTDTFCSCKQGFQSVGHNTCEGTWSAILKRLTTFFLCQWRLSPPANQHLVNCCAFFLDKNECKQFGMCSHICNNTKGSYKCSCHKYFSRINNTCKADSMCLFYSLNHFALRVVHPLQWIHLSKTFVFICRSEH